MPTLGAACLLASGCRSSPAGLPAPSDPGAGSDAAANSPAPPSRDRIPLPPEVMDRPLAASPPMPSPSPGADTVLFRVGSHGITNSDLADYLLRYLPQQAEQALSQLLEEALVDAEARAEGVDVPAEEVARRADAYVEKRRKAVRVEYGKDADFEALLQREFGRSVDEYRADARRLARSALLRERLVRVAQLRRDAVDVRILVFRTEAAARDAVSRIADGADLRALAQRRGLQPPAAPPPLGVGDVPDPELFAKLLETPDGGVVGPLAFQARGDTPTGEQRTWYRVVRVVSAWRANDAPWSEIASRVVRGDRLVRGPVRSAEVLQWRAQALTRHDVSRRDASGNLVRWLGD